MRGTLGNLRVRWRLGRARLLDVAGDLGDELLLALECALVAQAPPELKHEPLARRGRPRSPAGGPRRAARRRRSAGWCRSRSPRGGRPRRPRRSRTPGTSSSGSSRRFAVGKPSVPPRASPATTDALDLRGPPEQPRRALDLARAQQVADPARRHALDQRHRAHVEAEPREQARGRRPGPGRSGSSRPRRRPRSRSAGAPLDELLRRELRELEVELDDERLLDPGLGDQLEPALERRQQLDLVAERDARMRVERDDRRTSAPAGDARPRARAGGRGGRRRRSRSRPRAAARSSSPGAATTFTTLPSAPRSRSRSEPAPRRPG